MAKVYEPTTNLFALLADEADQHSSRKARNAKQAADSELTPKERADAKAVQDAERKAKREAEKARQQEIEARRKQAELVGDDVGFTQQRHQRIKEARFNTEEPEQKPAKGGKGVQGKGKGDKSGFKPKADGEKFAKNANKNVGKLEGKGNKSEGKVFNKNHNNNTERPSRGREFDKHSQGVISRKPAAKKGGHGKGNWDGVAKTVPAGTTAEEAVHNPEIANVEGEETADHVVVEGEAKVEEAVEETTEPKQEEEEDNELTLDQFQALQEAKKKELEALLGGSARAQPRALSEDETKALAKFTTILPSSKAAEKPKTAAKAVEKKTTVAPKKTQLDIDFTIARPPREDRFEKRGPRGQGRRDNKDQQKQRAAPKPKKLPKGKSPAFEEAFPTLG